MAAAPAPGSTSSTASALPPGPPLSGGAGRDRCVPRFTAQLFAPKATTPGTFRFLLGDAANAIHFWPGRGLNSGLASALSPARSLAGWRGWPLRKADFVRHEAVTRMLQHRHKSRTWRQMVTADESGAVTPMKGRLAQGIAEGVVGELDRENAIATLVERMRRIRARLEQRLDGLPHDAALQAHLARLSSQTLHTMVVSEPWDSASDVDWLLPAPAPEAAAPFLVAA